MTDDLSSLIEDNYAAYERVVSKACAEVSLSDFVKQFWHIVEPHTPLVWGWIMDAICDHLMAVHDGDIKRLIINVPPGFSKSLLTNVFYPAFQWTTRPHIRYLCLSYSQNLTIRDNRRFLRLVTSQEYQANWKINLDQQSVINVLNAETGWKMASSVGGSVTGQRANCLIIDDANNVAESESKLILESTNTWIREVMPDRLSNMQEDSIICIQQRTAEDDVTGTLLALEAGYEHLMIPMEYDSRRHCQTSIGWSDPRTEDRQLAFPERFPQSVVDNLKLMKGPWAWASQYSQLPSPRGGGIIKSDWWQLWPPQDSQPPEDGKLRYPMMDYIIAVCDTAYTTKEENDPSACIVLGVFKLNGINKVMLMEAWSQRLEFHDLKEKIVATCRKRRVDALIVEAKASGKSIAQEIRRLCREQEFVVYDIAPEGGDKVARLHSVVPLFAAKTVYAPDKAWAQMVIDQLGSFPKGKHDDLVDCVSMGLSYLRKSGIAMMPDEGERIVLEELQWMPESSERLYDV